MNKNTNKDQQEIATDQERRKLFLRYINRGWLIFGVVTLIALPFFPEQRSEFIYLVAVTFPTYLAVRILNLSGKTKLAGAFHAFVVDIVFYGLFLLLAREMGAEEAFRSQMTVWMLMALAVLFAGTLVDKGAAFIVALLNTALLIGTRLALAPNSDPRPSAAVFWWMIAITIWLYERTLQDAFRRAWSEVAERKQAAEALGRLEARFSRIFEVSPIPISLSRAADGSYLDVNESFLQFSGFTREEVLGRTPLDLGVYPEPEKRMKLLERFREQGSLEGYEQQFRTKSGVVKDNLLWVESVSINNEPCLLVMAMDITERKRADEKLRESEARLKLALEAARMGVWEWNQGTNVVYSSPGLYTILGLDGSELQFESFKNLIHPEDVDRVTQEIQQAISKKILFVSQFRWIRPDGKTIWLSAYGQVEYNESGKPLRIVGTIEDITDQAQVEEALRLQSTALEAVANSIVITDREGTIQWANPAFTALTGFSMYEALGKNPRDLIKSGKQDQEFYKNLWDTILAGQVWHGELINRRKDGTFYTEEMTLTPLKNEHGEATHFIAIKQDITERNRAEQELRESEQRYRLLAENSTDVIWTMDMNLRSTYTSPSVKRMRGFDPEEAISQPLEEALTAQSFEIVKKALEEELAVENLPAKDPLRSRTLDLEVLCKDGSTVWVETMVTFLRDQNGKPFEILGVNRDITDRKLSEQALRESEEKFRNIMEQSVDGITLTDERGLIIAWNQGQERITGLKSEQMLGKPVWEATFQTVPAERKSSDLFEQWKTTTLNFLKTGEAAWSGQLQEMEIERPDGKRRNVQAVMFPIQTGKGYMSASISRDVTDHKLAEQAVRDNQARLASIINSAMDAIVSLDANQRIILFNPAAERLFGCFAGEAIGQPLDRFIPQRSREAHSQLVHKFGRTNQTSRSMNGLGALTCLRADGEEFPAEISISQIGMAEGKIFTAIVRDVSERVRTEAMLNRRVGELTALYQTSLDIINTQDLPDLLNAIMARAVSLLGGTSGGLYRCDPEHKQVRCVVSYKTQQDYAGTVLAYGEGAAGTVAVSGEPLIIDDYRTWEGRAKAYEENQPFSAVISVPMLWQGQVTGVIHVLHDTQQRKFTDEDLKLLTSFANQASIAIENARLLEETQRRLDRLSILWQIDQVISSSLDLRLTMNILLGHILRQLEVDAAAVLLYRPELQNLEFISGQGFRTQALQFTNLRLGQGFAGRAALEQRIVYISDLNQTKTGFLRSPEFRNEGFIAYIGIPLVAKGTISGVLEIYHRQPLDPGREWMEYLHTLAGQAAIAIDNIRLFEDLQSTNMQLRQAYDATIEGWAQALEMRDSETEGHSRRTVELTLELARKMGIEENQIAHIRRGALLHDIGKMGIPDAILQKVGPLNEEEWEIIKQHTVYASKWLAPISYLQPALDIPACHHEKWDGTGYPRGLKGEQIPLAARIFAVVDVWDALTSDRPYRPAWSQEKVCDYILKNSGTHFDPKVVESFLTNFAGLVKE